MSCVCVGPDCIGDVGCLHGVKDGMIVSRQLDCVRHPKHRGRSASSVMKVDGFTRSMVHRDQNEDRLGHIISWTICALIAEARRKWACLGY